jgi:acetyl esterase/lipase
MMNAEHEAIDWDDAFANMAHVPGAEALPAQWTAEAAAFRASGVALETLRYGAAPRAELDLIRPEGPTQGLLVFVHGGYWMKFDRSYWTHFVQGALARGWCVAMPSYTLAPAARLSQMTAEIGAAIDCAAHAVAGPVRLAGHSAGGHLVARMLCADSPLTDAVQARVEHVVSISGLHDLRPLMHTKMNATLGIDGMEAQAESPALAMPLVGTSLTAWVGGAERPELIRQARLLDLMWSGLGARTNLVVDAGRNHFTVIEGLQRPDTPLMHAILGTPAQETTQ